MNKSILVIVVCQLLYGCSLSSHKASVVTKDVTDKTVSEKSHLRGKVEITPGIAEQFYNEGHYRKAFNLHLAIAKRGDDRSQYNVGVSYYEGIEKFMPQDLVEAYAWMHTSERTRSQHTRRKGIESLKKLMNPEQIKKGEARSNELFALYGSGKRVVNKFYLSAEFLNLEDKAICATVGTRIKGVCTKAKIFKGLGDPAIGVYTKRM